MARHLVGASLVIAWLTTGALARAGDVAKESPQGDITRAEDDTQHGRSRPRRHEAPEALTLVGLGLGGAAIGLARWASSRRRVG